MFFKKSPELTSSNYILLIFSYILIEVSYSLWSGSKFLLVSLFLYHYLFFKCLQSSIPLTRSKEKKNIKLEKLEFSLPFIIPFNLDKLTNICYVPIDHLSRAKIQQLSALCVILNSFSSEKKISPLSTLIKHKGWEQ